MAKTVIEMNDPKTKVDTTMDSVVVPHSYESFSIVLDVTGLPTGTEILKAGHMVVKTTGGVYKPQAVTGDVYAAMSAGDVYVGVLRTSILAAKPMAAVTVRGTLNVAAALYKPLADFADSDVSKFIRLTQDV